MVTSIDSSVSTTLIAHSFTRWSNFIARLATLTRSPNRWTRPAFIYAVSDFFGGDFEKNGESVYEDHYHFVRTLAAKSGRPLLEYRIEEGWGPLCSFLGHEKPDVPFPQGNTKAEVNDRIRAMINGEVKRILILLMIFLTVIVIILLIARGVLSATRR